MDILSPQYKMMISLHSVPILRKLRPRHPVLFGYRPKIRKKPLLPTAPVAGVLGLLLSGKKWTSPPGKR